MLMSCQIEGLRGWKHKNESVHVKDTRIILKNPKMFINIEFSTKIIVSISIYLLIYII